MILKKVSIIVPIYNVEKYIQRCVKSLMSQEYHNIEIILVNDGSPDRSLDIINKLKVMDSRIIVIDKNNGGVSSARNAGIKQSSGDYLMFVDGDDWIEPNYVSYFVDLIEHSGLPVGMNFNNYIDFDNPGTDSIDIISNKKAMEFIYLGYIFMAVWNKIYESSFIKKNNILFDETLWYGEGMLFNIDCLQKLDKVVVGGKSVYHQVTNPNSAMRKFNLKSNMCGIKSLEIQKNHIVDKDPRIIKAWNYHRHGLDWQIVRGLSISNQVNENIDIFSTCLNNLKKGWWKPLLVNIPFKSKVAYLCMAVCPKLIIDREMRKIKNP